MTGNETDQLPTHDFRSSSRMAGEQLRSLSAMHDVLAEELTDWLTAKLRENVRVALSGIEERTFHRIVGALERPICAYLYSVQGPGDLTVLFLVEPSLAFGSADRLLGGSGEPTIPDRAMTLLEQNIVQLVLERARKGIETMWADHAQFQTTWAGFEPTPDLLSFAEPGDAFLVSSFVVEGDGWSGTLHAHLPFALLETAIATGSYDGAGEGRPSAVAERRTIESSLLRARVTLDARLPAFTVALGELRDLAPGMVLNTRIPTTSPVEVSVSGQTRFTATAGRKGHELAVRILESAAGGSR